MNPKLKLPLIKDKQQGHLFKIEFVRIINKAYPIVKFANAINWDRVEDILGKSYSPGSGRPAISTRLMVILYYSNTFMILVLKRYYEDYSRHRA